MNTHVPTSATAETDAASVRTWLEGPDEIAFIDVREEGQFGLSHPLLAVNIPYSRLEPEVLRLVPRRTTRIVLADADDGVAARARRRLEALGYTDVHILKGGALAWRETGKPLFEGVNVPSKAFAEVVEHAFGTPHIAAEDLRTLVESGADVVVIDNRTAEEFERFHVPGATNAPGVDLVHRISDLVPSPETFVVVSCAGRTRGIMGAQSLISAGLPNRVAALAGGTQGWRLAGFELERSARPSPAPSAEARKAARERAAKLIAEHGLPVISGPVLNGWRAEDGRTTYLFDVRSPAEYRAGHAAGAVSAPGGQLLQTLDTFAAVRGARIVLTDDDTARAAITAYWLKQLGWDVAILDPDTPRDETDGPPAPPLPEVPFIAAAEARAWLGEEGAVLAVTSSAAYRNAHPAGAVWGIRPRLDAAAARLGAARRVLVVGEQDGVAALAARDLAESADIEAAALKGGLAAWTAAGLPVEASPGEPPDSERIDFLFWNHDRHNGNPDHSRGYLNWEHQLPKQIEEDGGAGYRLAL